MFKRFLKDERGSASLWVAFCVILFFMLGVHTIYSKYYAAQEELSSCTACNTKRSAELRNLQPHQPDEQLLRQGAKGLTDHMQVFNHNKSTNYQRMLTVRVGLDWLEEVVTRTFTVTTGAQPDLIVAALTPGQASYATGSTVSVSATVQNQGSASASGFYVSLNNESSTQTNYVSGLAAGASSTTSFTFSAPSAAQTLTLTATADYYNGVTESNENNNTRTATVSITALAQYPDLIVSALTPGQASYTTGGTVSVNATIKNQGDAAAGGFYVSLYNGKAGGRTDGVGIQPGKRLWTD